MRSVFSSSPIPFAKSRIARGLSKATGTPPAHSKAKACFSYPPLASIATSSTLCCRQNAASSAMPSAVLRKERAGPEGPTKASREVEETSTPQIVLVTVTCLVRAMESLATVRSCVTAAAVPKSSTTVAHRRDHGRRPPREGFDLGRTPHSDIVTKPAAFIQIQGTVARLKLFLQPMEPPNALQDFFAAAVPGNPFNFSCASALYGLFTEAASVNAAFASGTRFRFSSANPSRY